VHCVLSEGIGEDEDEDAEEREDDDDEEREDDDEEKGECCGVFGATGFSSTKSTPSPSVSVVITSRRSSSGEITRTSQYIGGSMSE
jgi:hypothetical protein